MKSLLAKIPLKVITELEIIHYIESEKIYINLKIQNEHINFLSPFSIRHQYSI